MAHSVKIAKNNVLRLLSGMQVAYQLYQYDCSDGNIDAVSVAEKVGRPPEEVFKTLVTCAPGPRYYVFIVPGNCELDLKKAARAAGEKHIEMLPVKELLPLTGYVHGGCSPFGMKKHFPTFLEETAQLFPTICVSAGCIGENVAIEPLVLAEKIPAVFADLIR